MLRDSVRHDESAIPSWRAGTAWSCGRPQPAATTCYPPSTSRRQASYLAEGRDPISMRPNQRPKDKVATHRMRCRRGSCPRGCCRPAYVRPGCGGSRRNGRLVLPGQRSGAAAAAAGTHTPHAGDASCRRPTSSRRTGPTRPSSRPRSPPGTFPQGRRGTRDHSGRPRMPEHRLPTHCPPRPRHSDPYKTRKGPSHVSSSTSFPFHLPDPTKGPQAGACLCAAPGCPPFQTT